MVTKAVQAISNGKWSGDFSLSQTGRCMLQAMSGPFLGNSSIFQVVNPSLLSYLNLRADPVNAGVVNGAGLYLIGQEIQLYAVASKGWMFANWSDGNTTNPRTITMTGFNPEVLAIFSPVNPPAIAQQPTNITIAEGQSAIFSVGVASQIPVNYSWFRNGILLQDATSSTLPILNARAQDSGSSYFCQVSNTEGHVTSQTVKLMVIPYPGSISQFSYKSELILQDNAVSQAKLSLQSITGGISKITVALNNFSHSFPHDLNLYLVSPQGKKVPLICHSGGAQPVTGINLIIDEDATTSLTEWDPLVSGIYQTSPNGDQTTDSLTSFKGCNPNGDWFLVVEDDSAGDSGTLQSWALTIWCDPLPRIISSPCAQIIQATKELKLSVLASNATTYVWFKDGVQLVDNTHIQGSTSSTLSISQVQADDSGEYSVIVCNATGRITSNPAVIRVIPYATPIIAVSGNYGVRKDGFHLPITGAQNATYEIQVSSDLINWKKLQTVTLLTGQTEIIDSSTNVIKRFYRAKLIKP